MKNRLPTFMCVGAQKAGTTSLHDVLMQDPAIYLPKIKETKFFQLDAKYSQGLAYYETAFFGDIGDAQIVGEVDPDYMYFDYVPKRIYEMLGGDTKLIFILRNPIDRALSHYQMSVKRGFEALSFQDALAAEEKRLEVDDSQGEFHESNSHNFSYLDRGYYSRQISEYLAYFPKKNMLFILFEEDFIGNRKRAMESIYAFLELELPRGVNLSIKSNERSIYRYKCIMDAVNKPNSFKELCKRVVPSKYRNAVAKKINLLNQRKINKETVARDVLKSLLKKHYAKELMELEHLIGRRLDSWSD